MVLQDLRFRGHHLGKSPRKRDGTGHARCSCSMKTNDEAYADAINAEDPLFSHMAREIGLTEEEMEAYDWFHASERQLPYVVHCMNRRGIVDVVKLAPARIVTFQGMRYAVSWNHEWRCVAFWTYDDVVRGLAATIRKGMIQNG